MGGDQGGGRSSTRPCCGLEAANRPLAARYTHKKKRIRKKYAKRILAWYREEIL